MSEIKECQVNMAQVLNVIMILGAGVCAALAAKMAMDFLREQLAILKKFEVASVCAVLFVGIASATLLAQGPLKPKTTQSINNVAYYDGKQVVPCDKNKKEVKVKSTVAFNSCWITASKG